MDIKRTNCWSTMSQYSSSTFTVVMTVGILATSGDITATWTSPVFPKLESNDSSENPLGYPVTANEESWIASIVYIGNLLGCFPFGYISARYGRKIALLCIAIPHIISYLTLAFAQKILFFYLARFLGGCSTGGGYTVVSTYVAEISPDSQRGMYLVVVNCFWCLGNLSSYIIGPYTSIMVFNLCAACLPTTFFILFLLLAPESPYYLLRIGKKPEATKCLQSLRNTDKKGVEQELEHMEHVLQHDDGTFLDLFRTKTSLKAVAISLFLTSAMQFSGMVAVLLYNQEIFAAAGVKDIPSEISSIIFGMVLLGTSFIAPFLTDRVGRRPLLNTAWFGMAISLAAFGIYYKIQSDYTSVDMNTISWLPLASLVIYITMLNVNVSWTLIPELFPVSLKPMACALTFVVNALTAAFVAKFFTEWNDVLGKAGTFFLFCGSCLAGFVFSFLFVPETKGKSFKEIQDILKQ